MADSAAGVECSEGHFHCDSCVARHAETFLDFDNLGQRKEDTEERVRLRVLLTCC